MRVRGVLPLLLTACQFERPADVGEPAVDAAPAECEAGTITCAASRYTACGADGQYVRYEVPNASAAGGPATLVMNGYACPLGCHATEPRCADLVPSNGVEVAFDEGEASPTGVDVTIDDPTGPATILDVGDGATTSVVVALTNGTNIIVPARVVPQPGGTDLRIVEVRSLTVAAGSRLRLQSLRPMAIVAHFDVHIAGAIEFSGRDNTIVTFRPACDLMLAPPATGGGGNGTDGGAASNGAPGSGAQAGNPELEPLERGCTSWTGIGGGGLQLVSRRRIALVSTAVIDVSGRHGNGTGSGSSFIAAGGGAGGSVLLEAPSVGFAPGSIVIGRGGGGAAGNPSTGMWAGGAHGNDDLGATSVPGGVCPDCSGRGGAGGTETMAAGAGAGSVAGGGGAVGRALVRAAAVSAVPSGTMKIRFLGFRIIATR